MVDSWLFFLGLELGLIFAFGCCLGSFFQVVIYRCGRGQDFVHGRSRCDHCGHQLSWLDNIPLLSFGWLGGRCRYCHQPINRRYPIFELATGLVTLTAFYLGWQSYLVEVSQSTGFLSPLQLSQFFNHQPQLVTSPDWAVMASLVGLGWLVVVNWQWLLWWLDAKLMIIPDFLTGGLWLIALGNWVIQFVAGTANNWLVSLCSTLAVSGWFLFLWLVTKKKGFGLGDVKLSLPLGLWLGYPRNLVAVFLAFILGSIYGIILMVLKKKHLKSQLAFGPFLILASWLSWWWGEVWWQSYWHLF